MSALRSASAAWPDELWAGSVAWADGILPSYYGIYEFTDDPSYRSIFCISFLAGTTIATGDKAESSLGTVTASSR
jgi:hypothetical protein